MQKSDSDSNLAVPFSSLGENIRLILSHLCKEYRRLQEKVNSLQSDQSSIKQEIEEILIPLGHKKISAPHLGWSTELQQKFTSSLDKKILIEECSARGIDPVDVTEIIKAATVKKPGKVFVKVLSAKEETEREKVSLEIFL